LLKIQVEGCLLIAVWAMGATWLTIVAINMIPAQFGLRLRLGRPEELQGLDEVEHDMAHEREDFQDVVQHFFATLSKTGSDDYEARLINAASQALKCMSYSHCMQDFSYSRVNRKCDMTLIVKEILVKGLNDSELKPGCMGTCSGKTLHMIVEVVSALRLESCFQRDYNYFAPRFSHIGIVNKEAHEASFQGEFVYDEFYVPPGSEDSTFVCLTILMADKVHAQCHLPFMAAGWKPLGEGEAGIEAFPTDEVIFFDSAVKAAHKEKVTCTAHFIVPVKTGGRRGSQIDRVVAEDKKAKGSLHHSEKLTTPNLRGVT